MDVRAPSVSTTGYADGLGRRVIRFDREAGATLESVQLRPELSVYEQTLRAQAEAVAGLDDERFVRVRSISRDGARVSVTSELIAGDRLADIIDARSASDAAVSGLDAAFGFLLQVLPALARLHAAGLVHGIVAPGRVILTSAGQVVLSDAIYGSVLPRLNLARRRLWTEFQVAAPPYAGLVKFDPPDDVAQASLCALMLALGRVIDGPDPIDVLPALVGEAVEIAQIRGGDHLAESIRRFFSATLPLAGLRTGVTADRAANDAGAIANGELGEDACLSALSEFLRYDPPPAPVPVPRPVRVPRPVPVLAFQAPAVVVPEAVPSIPDAVAADAIDSVSDLREPEIESDVVAEDPVAVAEPSHPETPAVEFVSSSVVELAVQPEQPSENVAPSPEPVVPLAATEPMIVETAAAPHTEPVLAAVNVAPAAVAEAPAPIAIAASVAIPVASQPIPAPFVAPEPAPTAAAAVVAPVIAPPQPEPLITKTSGDIVYQPEVAPAEPLVAATQVSRVPVPPSPPPMPVFSPPMPVFPPPPVAGPPTRPVPVAPNPFAFGSAPAAPQAAAVAAAPAPLRLKQEGPAGYAPPRPSPRFDPVMADVPFAHRAPAPAPSGFPMKMAAAVVLITIGAIAGGRYYMDRDREAAATDTKTVATSSKPAPIVQAKTTTPAVTTGTLMVESIRTGAKVLLNGTPAGETPLRLEGLPEGRHTLTLITDSVTVKRNVRVEAGKTVALDVPVFSGWIAIFAPIVLEVSEGNKGLGSTEQGRILLSPGRHVLTVTNRQLGYSSTHTVDIEAGEETPLNLTPSGRVNLNAVPWAEVWIDGNRAGETPLANLEVPLGTREFVFKHPQYGERRITTTITATPSALSVDFTKPAVPN